MSPAVWGADADAELLEAALEAARAAAGLIREHAARGVSVAATKSSEIDVVTAADREAEALIRDRLLTRRPDDAVLGEEGGGVEGTSGVRWIIDPIDGTVNFLYGIAQYAVSIAAERDGEVVAGVVLDVVHGTEYTGRTAGPDQAAGAWRDGRALRVRAEVPMSQRLIATGFSYVAEVRRIQAQAAAILLGEVRDLRRLGSCALDLCHVAEGALDGYVEEGPHLWDHAAGGLIARAAGARTEVGRGAGGTDLVICAPSTGFDEFRAATVRAGFWAADVA
ncbi:inositol monophosphatase family protein [Nocardioides sp. R-C-SC26]|uniref:inositol monophosphatase family protein n=1 Tax=Nocardioides sp. R-C-SC26 TaxID=2870414 RepID=UPI001E41E33E|nr:inositol monophosphatase family protein [Nocardioides sp. R-C-SC26]